MKKVVCVAGIETVRDGVGRVKGLSVTFLNNVLTFKSDHKSDCDTHILDCRDYKDLESPMDELMDAVSRVFGDKGIDHLVISCHSDPEGLYLFSHIRRELDENDRYINADTDWSKIKFAPDAVISLLGCQTAGRHGVRLTECIAQAIADKTGVKVLGFISKTSQHQRPDGGYFQKPESGEAVEVVPNKDENKP